MRISSGLIRRYRRKFGKNIRFKIIIIISQCSRQETNTLSPEGLPMSNIAEK